MPSPWRFCSTHCGDPGHPDPVLDRAGQAWPIGAPLAIWAAALLLGGAVGKSAQLPLQTWLPDAMAGPTPASALIHAATMVTAGVYLIARTHGLFLLAPPVLTALAVVVGGLTLLLAAFSALVQTDIKRVLAYSTMSQIGYMFLALGVGAWHAAIFHLMTHAFFKALLFLAAGAVIVACHHEQNIFQMGGLRRRRIWSTPLVFLVGGAALAALPLVTAGFYSKDAILWETWALRRQRPLVIAAGVIGAFLTSLYTFRLIFIVFFGAPRKAPTGGEPGLLIRIPLVVLGHPVDHRRVHQSSPRARGQTSPDAFSPDRPPPHRSERPARGPGDDRDRVGSVCHGGLAARSFSRVRLLPAAAVTHGIAREPSGRQRPVSVLVFRLGVRPPLRSALRPALCRAGRSVPARRDRSILRSVAGPAGLCLGPIKPARPHRLDLHRPVAARRVFL
ncbi:MAG: proton-conducting transporter membrane subunit [Candidatus Manganitrophus sp.]|nr:proton-conducting transporter membrane subunit [Candidatus Manganitrophus sp.]